MHENGIFLIHTHVFHLPTLTVATWLHDTLLCVLILQLIVIIDILPGFSDVGINSLLDSKAEKAAIFLLLTSVNNTIIYLPINFSTSLHKQIKLLYMNGALIY